MRAERMEPRILHSADVSPLVGMAPAATDVRLHQVSAVSAPETAQTSEIAFVDASVKDADALIADLRAQQSAGRSIEIVTIKPGEDGLSVIDQTLAGRQGITAIHLLTHGSDGEIQLGSVRLDEALLTARANELARWSDALAPGADLLVYGCDVAETARGQQFISDLSALTGADVAASQDLTGASRLGGNWTLEYAVGAVATPVAPSAYAQSAWQGMLAGTTYTVTSTLDLLGNLLPGTLRWAISQANANAGTDTIVFAVDGTFSIAALSSGDDTNGGGDFDITESLNIIGNGSGRTVLQGNGMDRVLDLRSGTISLSGLTVQGGTSGTGAGIRIGSAVNASLSDVVVQSNTGSGGTKGAGIYNDGDLSLSNVTVRNNGSTSGSIDGAGIYTSGNSTLIARDVEIANNKSGDKEGGGLYVVKDATATLTNVTFADNQAKNGGGLLNKGEDTILTNVTFSGNAATNQGGAIWSNKDATLDHVTIANNSAASAGGIHNSGGDLTLSNTLLAANTGGNASGSLTSLGYNLSDDATAALSGTGDRNSTASGVLTLASNGGYARTMALGVGSAAINAANPSTTLTADQRGVAYFGGRADIGAYEYNGFGFAPTVSTIANQTTDEDTPIAVAFVVDDTEASANGVTVTATSSNTALVANGSLVLSGTGANRTITLSPSANANSGNSGGTTTITLNVTDGGNVTTTTFTLNVLAINDAPTVSLPASQAIAEDTTLTLAGVNAPRISDIDAGSASVQVSLAVTHGLLTLAQTTGLSFVSGGSGGATMTFIGSQSAINAALDGLTYRPATDFNGADALSVSVNDLGNTGNGGAKTASATLSIAVAAVNDAPRITVPGPQVAPQAGTLVISAAGGNAITVLDTDAGGAVLQMTIATGGAAIGTLSLGSTSGLAFTTGSGSGDVTMTFSGTLAALNAALDGLTFNANPAFTGATQLQLSVDDLGNSGSGGPGTTSINLPVTVSNDQAPTLTPSRSSFVYVENDVATPIDAGLVLGDADNTTLAAATVHIATGYAGAEDELRFTNDGATMGNITGSYSAGMLNLSSAGASATVAQWQAALRSVSYANLSDQPNTAPRSISIAVNDGIADSASHSYSLAVTSVNDAPILSGANALKTIDEDATGNAGTLVSALIAGRIGDLDAASSVGIAVTGLDATHGQWQYTLDGTTWAAFGTVSDGAARLLQADNVTAIRFVPDADWNGSIASAVTFRAWDGSSGSVGTVADVGADLAANGGASAYSSTSAAAGIVVQPVNDAPVLASTIADQSAVQDHLLTFTLPSSTFTDADAGDALTYSATLASGAALPAWLAFDASTRSFTGTPGNADVGSILLKVSATDSAGASASGTFAVQVLNVNDAPTLAQPIAAQTAVQDAGYSFTLPADTFVDADAGDALTYSASLSSGAALPAWLLFDAATQTFTGTPGNGDVGSVVVRVLASDGSGAHASGDFTLTVANVNDAPQLVNPIADLAATQDMAFSFVLPAATFSDPDAGDVLHYSATLADGSALPAWLGFDGATRTLSGSPTQVDVGQWVIRVLAEDPSGASAQATFAIQIAAATPTAPPPATPTSPPAAPAPAPAAVVAPADLPPAQPVATAQPTAAPADPTPVATPAPTAPAPTPTLQLPTAAGGRAELPTFSSDAGPAPIVTAARAEAPPSSPSLRLGSGADAVLGDAMVTQLGDIGTSTLTQLLRSDDVMRKLDELQRQMLAQSDERHMAIASSVALSGGLSIGYVVWLVRGGVLVSSMLSALPSWQMIDPLPVLASARPEPAKRDRAGRSGNDEPEVERLFDDKARRLESA